MASPGKLLAVLVCISSTGCHESGSSEQGPALCEQIFRVEGQVLHPLGAGCGFCGGYLSGTFASDTSTAPDLLVVTTGSCRGEMRITATSRGMTVATGALSRPQLESGVKLVLPVTTLGGATYELRYWGSWTIDPGQYMDGIDAGWYDGAWH